MDCFSTNKNNITKCEHWDLHPCKVDWSV